MPDKQFYELPKAIQDLMADKHTHPIFIEEDEIVYREKDVCEIVKATIDYLLFKHEFPMNWAAVEEFIKQEVEALPGVIEKQITISNLINRYNRNSIRFDDAMGAAFDAGMEYAKHLNYGDGKP